MDLKTRRPATDVLLEEFIMPTTIITGAHGLIGSESVAYFCGLGFDVLGIDNDMRARFFGADASTAWQRDRLREEHPRYRPIEADIRNEGAIHRIFNEYSSSIDLVIHAAAQPSHDWAAREPSTDFTVNANGTLNLLEGARKYSPNACFIFTSTNKVYGDHPNRLPLIERELRWELDPSHPYYEGIPETMSIDQATHSLFGASKLAADILVQEYGRYFGMKTAVFRGGCLTGPSHSGAQLHGFLAYLVKCAVNGTPYQVFGYQGKQVRDNIHASDLVSAFYYFFRKPSAGEVYNIGGGRHSNCSVLEAIMLCEEIGDCKLDWTYSEQHRKADHKWWITDVAKFRSHYPEWEYRFSLREIIEQLVESRVARTETPVLCV
jgi:CDP-paratose 2-epimerase